MNQDQLHNVQESLKIGARVLRREQAFILLPSYDKLHTQVDDFRIQASRLHQKNIAKKDDVWLQKYGRDFEANYDNVISILGERGSGKSSILLTFKYHHIHSFSNIDIVLPLISPDQMSPASDTLGWVIGFLHDEMLEVDKQYKNQQEQRNHWQQDVFCSKEVQSELKKAYIQLQKAYVLRQESYATMLRKRDEGLAEHIQDNEKIVNSDQRLIYRFHAFINKLIETKKQVLQNTNQEPLILLFFDDVDISAGRCAEVLDAIRIFFSHPNIVVFVSGAYSVFLEATTIYMLRQEDVDTRSYEIDFVNERNKNRSALERRQERSREYLKKVFPPAFRYEMKSALTNKEKAEFKYFLNEKGGKQPPTFLELLAGMRNIDQESGLAVTAQHVPYAYFHIFDSNPRGLISPYYFMYLRKDRGWSGLDVLQFLETVIHSNPYLSDYKDYVKEIVRIQFNIDGTEIDRTGTFIDYAKLRNYQIDIKQKQVSNEEDIRLNVSILLLADWFEKMLGMFDSNFHVADHMKTKTLAELLNSLYGANILPISSTMKNLLSYYDRLDPILSLFGKDKILFDLDSQSHYLERQYLKAMSNGEGEYTLLRNLFMEDRNWVERLVNYINKVGKSNQEILDLLLIQAKQNGLFWHDGDYAVVKKEVIEWTERDMLELPSLILEKLDSLNSPNHIPIAHSQVLELAIEFIQLSELCLNIETTIIEKREKLKELSNTIGLLEESRWLRRAKINKSDIIIEKRIKKLEQDLEKMNKNGETKLLLDDYFEGEQINIDDFDIEIAYADPLGKDDIPPAFEEAIDTQVLYSIFYPVFELQKYLDINTTKQLVKKEKLKLVTLNFLNSEENSHLSEPQLKELKAHFYFTQELELLKLLLPAGKTTKVEELQALKNENGNIHHELNLLQKEEERWKSRILLALNEIASINPSLSFILQKWETEKSTYNRQLMMSSISELYVSNEEIRFMPFLRTLWRESGMSSLEGGWSGGRAEIFWRGLSDVIQRWIEERKQFIQTKGAEASLWQGIMIQSEVQNNMKLLPSVRLYLFAQYALEHARVQMDEKVDGSIAYFRGVKKNLRERSTHGYNGFDLYLRQALQNKLV